MKTIQIRLDNGKLNVTVDGALFRDVHSFSLDYIKGAPPLLACVADVGSEKEERREPRILN